MTTTKSRVLQYVVIILITAILGGGYWYWKQAHAGMNIGGNEKNLLTNGLVGYWTFDNPDISGTSAIDRSGSGNNGTLTNTPTKVAGKVGQALSFNGTNQYVTATAGYNFQDNTPMSVSLWMKTIQSGAVAAIGTWNYLSTGGWLIGPGQMSAGKIGFLISNGGGTGVRLASGSTLINDGTWKHVVVTYDGSSSADGMKFYVNGIADAATVTSNSAPGSLTNTNVVIGRLQGSVPEYYSGSIDEPRIYNRVLSQSEIDVLYQAGAGDKFNSADSQVDSLEKGLVGYWKLDDGSGTSATDASGTGNTGTLTGSSHAWGAGKIGSAVTFNGTDDYISTTTNYGNASTLKTFSVSAWFKTSSASGHKIVGMENLQTSTSSTSYDRDIYVGTDGKVYFRVYDSGTSGNKYAVSSGTYTDGNWHHALAVSGGDGSNIQLYVDGVFQQTTAVSTVFAAYASSYWRIGSYMLTGCTNGSNGYFPGSIDEARVYNRALSADEAAKLYRTTAPDNPDQGLVGYWPFNGPDVAGTTAYDRSGKGNNGTLTNSPIKTIGQIGQALSFNGTNQYVSLGSPAVLNLYTDYTISAWFKASAMPGNNGPIVSRSDASHNTYLVTLNSTGTVSFGWWTGSTGEVVASSTVASANKWYHIVATVTGGKQYIYVNGILDNSRTYGGTAASASGITTYVGDRIDAGGGYFPGVIDEPRIYSRAISSSEVQMLYQAGAGDKFNSADSQADPLEKGLAGYWKLDDASGTSAADASGNGNTGTLINSPTWTTGRINGALTFSGSSQYVNYGNVLDQTTGSFSLSAWFKSSAAGGGTNYPGILSKSNTTGSPNYYVRGYQINFNTTGTVGIGIGDGTAAGVSVWTTSTFNDGSYHHAMAVVDRGTNTLAFYVDGASQGSTSISGLGSVTNTASLQIGSRFDGSQQNYLIGSVDETRIYNRALSADEVAKLYQTTAPDNPDTGLVGYWPFNGTDVAGTTAYDRSGIGNNGTFVNSPVRAIGQIGQALSFNGTNQTVDTASTSTYANQNFSVSAWVNPGVQNNAITAMINYGHNTGTNANWVIQSEDATTNRYYYLAYYDGTSFEPAGNYGVGKGIQLTTGVWQHIVYTKTGTTVTGYLNGVVAWGPYAAASATVSYASRVLRFGNADISGTRYFKGSLDEVRVYSRALSQAEITAQYNAGR